MTPQSISEIMMKVLLSHASIGNNFGAFRSLPPQTFAYLTVINFNGNFLIIESFMSKNHFQTKKTKMLNEKYSCKVVSSTVYFMETQQLNVFAAYRYFFSKLVLIYSFCCFDRLAILIAQNRLMVIVGMQLCCVQPEIITRTKKKTYNLKIIFIGYSKAYFQAILFSVTMNILAVAGIKK